MSDDSVHRPAEGRGGAAEEVRGMMKRESPYVRLQRIAGDWANRVLTPQMPRMWFYPKEKLGEAWALTALYERTKAAEQLGYRVELVATDEGLDVRYRQDLPARPYEF